MHMSHRGLTSYSSFAMAAVSGEQVRCGGERLVVGAKLADGEGGGCSAVWAVKGSGSASSVFVSGGLAASTKQCVEHLPQVSPRGGAKA